MYVYEKSRENSLKMTTNKQITQYHLFLVSETETLQRCLDNFTCRLSFTHTAGEKMVFYCHVQSDRCEK